MYIPKHYHNEDIEDAKSFIANNSFGILVTSAEGKSLATHVPLELSTNSKGDSILQGHISKENPQWQHFIENTEVLCIFNGPHSYVSSSWYEFETVPTWNYIAVHTYGTIQIIEGNKLLKSLSKMIDKYEVVSENPVKMENLSEKTMRLVNGIIGFEIKINDIQAKKKLSQNKNKSTQNRIISELNKSDDFGAKAIAKEMKNEL